MPDLTMLARSARFARPRPARRPRASRLVARMLVVTTATVLGGAALPSVAQVEARTEAEWVCISEVSGPVGGTTTWSQHAILHPGCGNLVEIHRFAEPALDSYYRSVAGFDRNFLRWAPEETRWDLSDRKFAGCVSGHPHGTLCPGGIGNIGFGFSASADWDAPMTVKVWGDGFIALACGNWSQTGTRHGPIPRISGTKFDDRNGNGHRDAGEPGLGGVTIRLRLDGTQVAVTTTASDGSYRFDLDAEADARYTQGTYSVVEDVPAGYRQTAAPDVVFVPFGAANVHHSGRDFGNQKVVDVGVEKTAGKHTTIAGESLTWTLAVTNHGLWPAPGVTVTDEVPTELDTIDQLDPACSLSGRTITCLLGTMAPGARRELTFRTLARPDLARGSTVVNAASVTTEMPDIDPGNDRDDATTTIDTRADLVAGKRVDRWLVHGGEDVVYRLTVRNDGPSYARDVQLRDEVPGLVEIVSTEPAGACTVLLQQVSCAVGDLAPGQSAEVVVRGRAVGLAPPPPDPSHGDHLIGVDRAEAAVSFDAGQQRTVDVACPAGGIVTDGGLRIDAVDQGTGTKADVVVHGSFALDRSTFRVVAENTATGRAQGHVTVTCLRPRTVGGEGASHGLLTDAPVSRTDVLPVGRHAVRLAAGLDRHAVAPGFEVLDGRARLVASEPTDDGWELTYDVLAAATVRSSIVPLHGRLEVVDGHTHRLPISHPERTVSLPPGESEHSIDCGPLEKSLTASWDVPSGIVPIGEEGRPRSRNFWFLNPGSGAVQAKIDTLCVGDRTSTPRDPQGEVPNTVTVHSDTEDPVAVNDSASASIVIDRAVVAWGAPAVLVPPASAPFAPGPSPSDAGAPSAAPAPDSAPAPRARPGAADAAAPTERAPSPAGAPRVPRASVVSVSARPTLARRTIAARIRCGGACALRVELRVGGRTAARGTVRRAGLGTSTVRLRLSRANARRVRDRGAKLVVRDRASTRVVATRTVARR